LRYYIIAGEASGDLHASNLIRAIRDVEPKAEFRAWGGDHILSTGVELVNHYRDTAFMGFLEVIKHLPTILKFIKDCKRDILDYKPDVVIFIDYPGFNFRIAEFAHANSFKTAYYISPQLWAWKSSRIKKLKMWIDELLVILPFEKEFYTERQLDSHFVGHPLLDELSKTDSFTAIPSDKPIIALLPGSRLQEIERVLPIMLEISEDFPDYQFIVAGLKSIPQSYYNNVNEKHNVELIYNQTYNLLSSARAAIVTSGTATLETALFKVPQMVVYKSSAFSYHLGKRLVKVKFISLVNLILNRELVKEFIQNDMKPSNIKAELNLLLNDIRRGQKINEGYKELEDALGNKGASQRAAEIITNLAYSSSS